jgi:beta-glucanase (GH16 family)
MSQKTSLRALLAAAVAANLFVAPDGALSQAAQTLDMSKLEPTFKEDFDSLSVSPWGPNTRWIAHTPWNGDFGDARFADPQIGIFPFTIKDGILRIEARRNADGKWESGLLASVDPQGRGFSQQYGYFEIRAKLPGGPGTWPAFWIGSVTDKNAPASVEIDPLEFYGHSPAAYQIGVRVWRNPDDPKEPPGYVAPDGSRWFTHPEAVQVPPNSLTDDFNTYGVKVDPEWIIFYLNRKEVYRAKTPKEHTRPLHVLLNLALGSGWPIDKTPNPSYMYVDYVHVYRIIGNQ